MFFYTRVKASSKRKRKKIKYTELKIRIVKKNFLRYSINRNKGECIMGLFSKKKKELLPEYDKEDCELKKKRMREIFNKTVENGDSYDILYAYMTSSKFEHGFVFDTNTTSFYYYIVGYRKSDFNVVLIQVDSNLGDYSEACPIDMSKVVNVSYNSKYQQLCFIYEKGSREYGELLNISGTDSKTLYGPKNIYQVEEREKFLDFAEDFRTHLQEKGYKLEKWKREK